MKFWGRKNQQKGQLSSLYIGPCVNRVSKVGFSGLQLLSAFYL